MISESEDEGLSSVNTKIVVLGGIPLGNGSVNSCVNVGVVPEEVVGDALGEEGRVSEDGEELAELGEVVGDSTTVVDGGREVLEELADIHNSLADANRAALLEVSNHVLNVNDHRVGAVHAAEQVVEVVSVENAVHDSSENSDDVQTVKGLGLVE